MRVVHTKRSPVTRALTGSSCSFLFLPNIISIVLLTVNRCSSVFGDCSRPSLSPLPAASLSLPPFRRHWLLPVLSLLGGPGISSCTERSCAGVTCLVKGQFPGHVSQLIFNPPITSPALPFHFHFWLNQKQTNKQTTFLMGLNWRDEGKGKLEDWD